MRSVSELAHGISSCEDGSLFNVRCFSLARQKWKISAYPCSLDCQILRCQSL